MLETAFQGHLNEVPAATLAYVGDAVYELKIRDLVLGDGRHRAGDLHRLSIRYVCASFQASVARKLSEDLWFSAKEELVFMRGRNSDPGVIAKHADPVDYRLATGLETLVGYLYLTKDRGRLDDLFVIVAQLIGASA